MPLNHTLVMDLHGFWHAGSGQSAGALADALVQRSPEGLPVVGGRHLKGLLRHALHKAECLGWFSNLKLSDGPAETLETLIFGDASQEQSRFHTLAGMLVLGDGRLPEEESAWLAHPEQAPVRQNLFRRLSSTAMTERGTARKDSLRTMEVTVPMSLQAQIRFELTAADDHHLAQQKSWLESADPWAPIREACTLIDSLGASRSRGLGEAQLYLADNNEEGRA